MRAAAPKEPDEDRQLVDRARGGDASAFRALFDRHAPAVRRFLRDLSRDDASADEAAQETFVRAHAGLGALRDGDRLRPWLLGIGRRVIMEDWRRLRRPGRFEVEVVADVDIEPVPSPESALIGAEASRVFRAALGRLAPDRRAILLLQLDHGLSYDEIAALMTVAPARVRNELHRAREELRAFLAPYFENEP